MRILVAFLVFQVTSLANLIYGVSTIPELHKSKDFDTVFWTMAPSSQETGQYIQGSSGQPKSTVIHFNNPDLERGAFCYVSMPDSDPAPLKTGGFSNGQFQLNVNDLAGPSQGYTSVDANGWPCIKFNRQGSGVWRQYRFLNQPFSPITVTLTQ